MTFTFRRAEAPSRYAPLGLKENPYPVAGQTSTASVPRPELDALDHALMNFLEDAQGVAGIWYLEGEAGTGKTNFLLSRQRLIEEEIRAHGRPWAVSYVPGTGLTPRGLLDSLVRAVGEAQIEALLLTDIPLGADAAETDFARAYDAAKEMPSKKAAAAFLARWLGGHQTYAKERAEYAIYAAEKLSPAVALPYFKYLFDALRTAQILSHIVVFVDEIENVLMASSVIQNEYFLSIKNLVNIFNFQHVFVVLAGLPEARTYLMQTYASLASRITATTAKLQRLKDFEACKALADAYLPKGTESVPDEDKQRIIFSRMPQQRGVLPRDYLNALREWIENEVNEHSPNR